MKDEAWGGTIGAKLVLGGLIVEGHKVLSCFLLSLLPVIITASVIKSRRYVLLALLHSYDT